MNEIAFVKQREDDWKRLYVLCLKADASPVNLTQEELHEFLQLYKRVSGDLALVRTKTNNRQLIEFLNDLAGKAYATLYRPVRGSFWKAVGTGIRSSAQTVRRLRWFVLASLFLFLFGIVQAFVLMSAVPETRDYFLPDDPGWQAAFDAWKTGKHQERTASEAIAASGFYSSNNPRAAIATGAIAAGTFGLGSIYLLWMNGALLGTLLYEVNTVGHARHLLVSVSPHGATEISGLVLAGASGLRLGWALLVPGRRRRGESLRYAGKDAIVLLTTAVVMMFIAAPVEAFFSFNPAVPELAKVLFALATFSAWLVFWFGYGKTPDELEDRQEQE
jgi:uncharacterized membrane protein SpoIIM required for sporulation